MLNIVKIFKKQYYEISGKIFNTLKEGVTEGLISLSIWERGCFIVLQAKKKTNCPERLLRSQLVVFYGQARSILKNYLLKVLKKYYKPELGFPT